MSRKSYRFATHDRTRDTIAATWNCRAQGCDIYLFSRSIGYALKFSLHTETGQCHLKYTPTFMDKNQNVLRDEYVDTWTYRNEGPYVNPLTVVTPPAAVNSPFVPLESKTIELIPSAVDGNATFVGLFVLAPQTEIKGDPLVIHKLPSGEHFVLATKQMEMPTIKAPDKWPVNFFEGHSSDSLEQSDRLRMMVLAGEGEARTIFDFVGKPSD